MAKKLHIETLALHVGQETADDSPTWKNDPQHSAWHIKVKTCLLTE